MNIGFILKNILIGFSFLLIIGVDAYAQPENFKNKNQEFGIDITNTLTFLKKNNQSYLLNYRLFLNDHKTALRAGLNLDLGTGISDGYYPSLKVGVQKNKYEGNWNTYYGVDVSYFYFKSNATPTSTSRYGFTPLVGVQFFTKNRITVSTEAGLNYFRYYIRSKNSFDPVDKTSYAQVNIGYVGMFLVSYRF